MTTKKSTDPVARLAELERARDVARQAEDAARDEHASRLRGIPVARAALTQTVAAGGDVKAAEEAFAAAQKAAGDPALSARAEGLAQRTRAADAAVRSHINDHLGVLVEELRPRAEAAVAIKERAADLRDALAEYHAVGGELSRRTAFVQWFPAGNASRAHRSSMSSAHCLTRPASPTSGCCPSRCRVRR